jgi:hypothetical protein
VTVEGETPLPILFCSRVAQSIRIDGDIHKPPWTEIAPVWLLPSHGRTCEMGLSPEQALRLLGADAPPPEGGAAFQPTALRACYDASELYLAFQCVDCDIFGSYSGRNEPIYTEDVVEAFLAPGRDPRHYFELEMSPRGAWFEASVLSPDGDRRSMVLDTHWTCGGWRRGVRVRGRLQRQHDVDCWWSAEWAIPFRALGGAEPPRRGERWRGNFFRIDRAGGGQFSAWSPTFADPPDFHRPRRFGILEFT